MPNINAKEYSSFESIKHISEDGSEFWYARELAAVLEYTQWRNFAKVRNAVEGFRFMLISDKPKKAFKKPVSNYP